MTTTDNKSFAGLTAQQAAERLGADGFNELPNQNKHSVWLILWRVIREPMFALLLGGGLVYLLLGDKIEALLLILFAGFSVSISLIQETRSERVLESLRNLASPRALVIRDNQRITIAGREVVRGDVLVVGEGDRVAADADLLEAQDLLVDESLLTGESAPATKQLQAAPGDPGDKNSASLFAGTLVVRGRALAEVKKVGAATEMGQIGQALNTIETAQPHLQRQLKWLIRDFAIVAALAAGLSILLFGLWRGSWLEALLGGIALAMSLLPEEFPLVLAVFMAMGAWRISKVRVLTRRASAIETLGATTVLCTDKTGTLTENRMALAALHQGELSWQRDESAAPAQVLIDLVKAAGMASVNQSADPMDLAVFQLINDLKLGSSSPPTPVKSYGLRPELLAVVNVYADETGESAFAKGAWEAVAGLCHLTEDQKASINQVVDSLATKGMRLLAVAKAHQLHAALPDSPTGFNFEYLGLLGFADPLRANVPAAVVECRSAGIRVVMITGDYALTASAIAQQAGIETTGVLSGDDLEKMTDDQWTSAVSTTSIFARIRPSQKLRIVQSLKAKGDVVAMTGDGVNDAPAIKAADIGIAMGGRGTDVAREAAAIVLLDDDFSSIVTSVRLGRRIYDNLRKAIEYIVAVHIPIAGLALIPLFMGLPLMLAPIHIAFLEMVIDPACSIVFEAEEEEDDVMARPPRNPESPLLEPRRIVWGLLQGLVVLLLLTAILVIERTMAEADLRVLVFTALVMLNMGLILVNRSFNSSVTRAFLKPNRSLWLLLGAVTLLLSLAIFWPAAQRLFHFGHLSLGGFGTCIAVSLLGLVLLELIKGRWFRTRA